MPGDDDDLPMEIQRGTYRQMQARIVELEAQLAAAGKTIQLMAKEHAATLERAIRLEAENSRLSKAVNEQARQLAHAVEDRGRFISQIERRGGLLQVAAGALELIDAVLPDKPNAEFIRRIKAELEE